MVKIHWEDEFVFYLIDKVHKAEHMWNYRNPSYKNKFKKQQFWLKIVHDMNEEFEANVPFTYGEVLKKWNNLKSYYSVENQKMYKAQKSGAGVEDVENIQSSWKFKSRLDFLLTTVEPTPSVNNFNKRSFKTLYSEEDMFSHSSEFFSESSSQALNKSGVPEEFLKFKDSSATSTPISPSFNSNEESSEKLMELSKEIIAGTTYKLSDSNHTLHDVLSSPINILSNEMIALPKSVVGTQLELHQSPKSGSAFVPIHLKKKPRATKTLSTQSLAATLLENSTDLTKLITQNTMDKTKNLENSAFGACISDEINKLAPDLQIIAKKQIFGVIMDLQAEQLKRSEK